MVTVAQNKLIFVFRVTACYVYFMKLVEQPLCECVDLKLILTERNPFLRIGKKYNLSLVIQYLSVNLSRPLPKGRGDRSVEIQFIFLRLY